MKGSKSSRRQKDAYTKTIEKRQKFVKMFIEQDYWHDEDLVAFIAKEFNGNVENINWILKTAIESKSWTYNIIEVLMKNGTELQVLNDLGQTAIHIATKHPDKDLIVDLLFEYSRNENLSDKEGFTYLHVACMSGCHQVVQKFIDQGVDINLTFHKNGRIETPLSLCIESELYGTIKLLKLLLNNGADLKLVDEWSEAPLHCLKRLFECDTKNVDRFAVLQIIGDHHFVELLKNLSDSGMIANCSDSEGFTYLHAACMYGNIEMVQKFIDQKFDLDLTWQSSEMSKESPLTLATKFNRIEIVKLLLKNGAEPNIKVLGKNPLHIFFKFFVFNPFLQSDGQELLELLISYNCDINAKDHNGCSPLFLCFESCNENPIHSRHRADNILGKLLNDHKNLETLLRNGADANEVFTNGQSALNLFISADICRLSKLDDDDDGVKNVVGVKLVKTLLKYGADPNATDDNGDSPLQFAVLNNNSDVVEALLDHGADVQCVDLSKIHWKHDYSVERFDEMIKLFMILNHLESKGYKMNESSCLTVLKILVASVSSDPENSFTENLKNTIIFGSSSQIHLLVDYYVKNQSDHESRNDSKYVLALLLHTHLLIFEKGNILITAEMKNCLQKLQQFYILDQESIDYYNAEISIEIEYLKKLKIKDGVSFLDVCTSSSEKAYELLKDFKFWTLINSDNFELKCYELSNTIKGYIVKCFMRKLFMDIGLEYLILLTQGKFPLLCCDKVINYLNYDDVLFVCQMAMNKI